MLGDRESISPDEAAAVTSTGARTRKVRGRATSTPRRRRTVQPTDSDLVIVVPNHDPHEVYELVERLKAQGRPFEVHLDRRRQERRQPSTSDVVNERRQRERRILDLREPLRTAMWILIPAKQRRWLISVARC